MSIAYTAWLGCQVSLKIQDGELRVPLRGLVVNESSNAFRVRIEGCWDLDIFKEMIVPVEAINYGTPGPRLHCAPDDNRWKSRKAL